MKKPLLLIIAAMTLGTLVACSSSPKLTSQQMPKSGFLSNYDSLHPVATGDKNSRIWRYRKVGVNPETYKGIIINPIYVNQTANDKEITPEMLAKAKEALQQSMISAVKSRGGITIVNKPGPGVAILSVGITGAELSNDSLKAWNYTPIGLAVNAAAYASGVNAKTLAMLVESKITDSQTNEVISEALATIEGESFRTGAGSVESLVEMAKKAVRLAMQTAADTTPIPAK